MNIQPITSVKAPVFTGKVITNKTYVTKPMKSDSFESSESAEKIEEIKTEYESKLANLDNEWREKYKARFFSEKDDTGNDGDESDISDDEEKTDYSDLFEEKED